MTYSKSLAELQAKVAKTVIIASIILLLALSIYDFAVGLYLISTAKLPLILLFIWNYKLLGKYGYKEKFAHITVITTIVFFAINYFNNQGTDGPTMYGVICLFIAYPILFSTKWKWFYMLFTLLFVVTLLYIGTNKENLVLPNYASPQIRFIDHVAGFTAVSVYLMLIVSNVIDFYKKQNAQLGQTQSQLKEQIIWIESEKKQKENLLGIFAHDVKNPLVTLEQLIEMYQNEALSQEELRNLLQGMQSRFVDLQNTIEQIMSQIKTDIHKNPIEMIAVNPIEITQKLLHTLVYKFEAKFQKLIFNHPHSVVKNLKYGLNANEVSIILKNLLDNACKYSPENTEVKISLSENNNQLTWSIEDEGQGVSEELQKDLFTTEIHSKKGSGIGLFLCKSIAQNIGAELKYIPKKSGSIFQLILNII